MLAGASVTTAADLADRVGGSLVDAKNLAGKLGSALTIVALVAAFLIASLLTLSSVTKRIRELGTLKALGWPQRQVVRQVTGESLLQGALGGVLGALLGIAGAAAINAVGLVAEGDRSPRRAAAAVTPAPGARRAGGGAIGGIFGQGQVASGSTDVTLHAPGRRRADPARHLARAARRPDRRVRRRPARRPPSPRRRPATHRLGEPMTDVPIYDLRGVSRSVSAAAPRACRAVDEIDLRIERGEFVVVAGPSGSGKTTLLQLLGALDRPTAGEIAFEGRPLDRMGDGELAALRRAGSGSCSSSST